MSRKTTIDVIWRLTIISFIFVQLIGIIVIVSVVQENQASLYQVIGAYIVFLLFSGFIFLAAQRIRKMVKVIYRD